MLVKGKFVGKSDLEMDTQLFLEMAVNVIFRHLYMTYLWNLTEKSLWFTVLDIIEALQESKAG